MFRALKKLEQMDQFIAYGDEFLNKDIVDGIHKKIKVTTTNYLENTLSIIKFWRVFYYNKLREKIDAKSWLKHGEVSVVNAFYSLDGNSIEFPGLLNHILTFNLAWNLGKNYFKINPACVILRLEANVKITYVMYDLF